MLGWLSKLLSFAGFNPSVTTAFVALVAYAQYIQISWQLTPVEAALIVFGAAVVCGVRKPSTPEL